MRLLNAKTLELRVFFDSNAPPYLILSHRWTDEEPSLQEFEAQKNISKPSRSLGIRKIKQFCQKACKAAYDWVWVDTCCIDKTSSAELTESINSMWRWYRQADQCYVYLDDVATALPAWINRSENEYRHATFHAPLKTLSSDVVAIIAGELAGSDWFRRGWTLQELLAPRIVLFFDPHWRFMCNRDEGGIQQSISDITHVNAKYFGSPQYIRKALIAERMSWMCNRKTRLVEDIAYCLLGLFDVHMPLIYGEGWNAFYRLQLEIIAKYDDESIFAWQDKNLNVLQQVGMLAAQPISFAWVFEHQVQFERKQWFKRGPYKMTNKGIEFEVFDNVHIVKNGPLLKVPLNCWVVDKGWICLEIGGLESGSLCRVRPEALTFAGKLSLDPERPDEFRKRSYIYVRQFDIT